MSDRSSPGDRGAETTAVLLEGARRGDARALDALLRRYRPRLRRWASGRLPRRARHQEDTDDLVQEALVQTIARMQHLRQTHTFHAYVRTAVLNRIRNHLRHADVRERGADAVPRPSENPSPLDELIGQDAVARYERALASLSDADQEILVAHLELDLTGAELADVTGRPSVNAARMALQRALVRLAQAMDPEEGGGC